MKILLATNNLGKIREFEFLFNNSDFKLVHLREFSDKEIPETGNSYEENAFLKAKEAFRMTKLPVLADDSGLEVESIDTNLVFFQLGLLDRKRMMKKIIKNY